MMSKMFFIIWLSSKKIRKNNKDNKLGMYNIKVVHFESFFVYRGKKTNHQTSDIAVFF